MYSVRGKEAAYDIQGGNDKRWNRKIFFIRNLETMSIEELPSKYLMHKIKCKRSPNTVKRTAFSICYYMKYMAEKEMELTEVYQLDYEKQTEHFVEVFILA